MGPQNIGLYGGIAGGIIGVFGGLIGTAVSVVNTSGPRERSFVIRCAILLWLVLSISLTAAFFLPSAYRVFAIFPMVLALPWLIKFANRRQERLRSEEHQGTDGRG